MTLTLCRFRTSRSNGAGRLRFSIKWIVFQRGGRRKRRGRPGEPTAGPEREEEEEECEDGGGEEETERGEGGEGQVGLGLVYEICSSRHRFGLPIYGINFEGCYLFSPFLPSARRSTVAKSQVVRSGQDQNMKNMKKS